MVDRDVKLIATDGSHSISLIGELRPVRANKHVQYEWRIRYKSAYKPIKYAKPRHRETVTFQLEGECDQTTRNAIDRAAKAETAAIS